MGLRFHIAQYGRSPPDLTKLIPLRDWSVHIPYMKRPSDPWQLQEEPKAPVLVKVTQSFPGNFVVGALSSCDSSALCAQICDCTENIESQTSGSGPFLDCHVAFF